MRIMRTGKVLCIEIMIVFLLAVATLIMLVTPALGDTETRTETKGSIYYGE